MELILGDAVEAIKHLPKVDLILTDPPYPDYYQDEFGYQENLIDVFKKFSCRQFIFWSAKVEFPLDYTARHVWDKITGAACQYDFIYERNGGRRQRVFRGHRINSSVSAQFAKEKFSGHKSQKPLTVLEKIIEIASQEGDTVLDPFMGSGSTLVAAKKLKRNGIGIEIKDEYYEMAVRRLHNDTVLTFSEVS